MINLTEKEIKQKISTNPFFKDCTFPPNTVLDLSNTDSKSIVFDNIVADGLSIINGSTTFLSFVDCEYLTNLSLEELTIGLVRITNCTLRSSFYVGNCDFEDITFDRSNALRGSLEINASKVGAIQIRNGVFAEGLSIIDCTKIGDIFINNLQMESGKLFIASSQIGGYLYILEKCRFRDILLFQSTVSKDALISNQVEIRAISIVSCEFQSLFSSYEESVLLSEISYIGKFELNNCTFQKGFSYSTSASAKGIEELKIVCGSKMEGNINFDDMSINRTEIIGNLTNCNISFKNINFTSFSLNSFYNQGQLRIRNLRPVGASEFSVIDSDLHTTYINRIDFNQISKVVIYNSTLRHITYSDIKWPRDIFVSKAEYMFPEKEKYFRYQNLYRQLKQAAKLNDNKSDELRFQRTEWEFIRKTGQNDKTSKTDKVVDWVILTANWSNNFGTNWLRPIFLLVTANFFFYTVILIALNKQISIFDWNQEFAISELWAVFREKFWLYLHFLNPTHNIKHFEPLLTEPEYTPFISNGWAMFWNVIMRLFTGYFIYQTIVAFRKFSRK